MFAGVCVRKNTQTYMLEDEMTDLVGNPKASTRLVACMRIQEGGGRKVEVAKQRDGEINHFCAAICVGVYHHCQHHMRL